MTEKETQLNSPDNKKPNTQIPAIFQSIKTYENETEDIRFLKIKIWLMHTGENFNGSSFAKEVVNKHLHTLANTPILAFLEENSDGEQDFSDHRMVLHRTTDGGVELKYLGSAVGVIPEDNNARWETRVTDDGQELEYLVVDALMWKKWDEPINIMKEKGFTAQSMELADNYSGNWDKDGVFHFESFSFFGACLLGEGVMPAMKSSVAEVQFSKNENIKNTIEDKLQEFYTLFSQEGGKKMEKEIPVTLETPVSTLDMFTEAQFTEAVEMNVLFDAEPEVKLVEEVVVEEVVEAVEVVDYEAKFNDLSTQYTSLQSNFDTLKTQLDELNTYKRQREESDIKAKFEGKLSDEEFTQVFTELKDSTLEVVEDKLFALIGKKNFSIQTPKSNANKIAILSRKDDEKSYNPYGDIFEN